MALKTSVLYSHIYAKEAPLTDPIFRLPTSTLSPPPLCKSPPRAEPCPALAPILLQQQAWSCSSLLWAQPCSLLVPPTPQLQVKVDPATAQNPPWLRAHVKARWEKGLGKERVCVWGWYGVRLSDPLGTNLPLPQALPQAAAHTPGTLMDPETSQGLDIYWN